MVDTSQITALNPFAAPLANALGLPLVITIVVLIVISIWSLVWKGFALWKSAKKGQPIWFVVLLILNTIGILEILYIYVFSKIDIKSEKASPRERPNNKRKK